VQPNAVLYRAPEQLLGCPVYDAPGDMWTAGLLMAEMARGRPLFEDDVDSEIGLVMAVFRCAPLCPAAAALGLIRAVPGSLLGSPTPDEMAALTGGDSLVEWPCWRREHSRLRAAVPVLDDRGLDLLWARRRSDRLHMTDS
jgi:serine/threonine protein kinase